MPRQQLITIVQVYNNIMIGNATQVQHGGEDEWYNNSMLGLRKSEEGT